MMGFSALYRFWETVLITFLLYTSIIKHAYADDFILHQSLQLTQAQDGVDGRLEVMRDLRLSEKDINIMKKHDPEDDPQHASIFKTSPLRRGIVRLLASNGKVLRKITLEKFYATIETVKLKNNGTRTILITQDFGIGIGSYNGPITKILEIGKMRMRWALAHNFKSRHYESIALMRSLKTAWNFSPGKIAGELDILKISCRPDETEHRSGFRTTYSRYHHHKNRWVLKEFSEDLFWEAEDGEQQLGVTLPDAGRFPRL